jgi:hypothetical protein
MRGSGRRKRWPQGENEILEAEFIEEEFFHAIKESYVKGRGQAQIHFYHNFWSTIQKDFMTMIRNFERGELNIARLNYAMIILIPKKENDKTLRKFRHIRLINCNIKVFSKALNNKLESICHNLLAWLTTRLPLSRGGISLKVWCLLMRSYTTLLRIRKRHIIKIRLWESIWQGQLTIP